MGMHFGLVAIKGSVADFIKDIPLIWPKFEIAASEDRFSNVEAVWLWMKEHKRFVSAASWTKENPGTECVFITQFGPWAIFMDPSYVHTSDEKALKQLSDMNGLVLSFAIETAGGCAYFWCYDSGQLKRSILNTGDEVLIEGSPLAEESGLNVEGFYMDETQALMNAFGLPSIQELPIPAATTAIALTDHTDYSKLMNKMTSEQNTKSAVVKPWWRFW